jgi:hypothetical protein
LRRLGGRCPVRADELDVADLRQTAARGDALVLADDHLAVRELRDELSRLRRGRVAVRFAARGFDGFGSVLLRSRACFVAGGSADSSSASVGTPYASLNAWSASSAGASSCDGCVHQASALYEPRRRPPPRR